MENEFYALVAFENHERFPFWKTTGAATVIPIFKTEMSAKHFAAEFSDEDWLPVKLDAAQAETWIRRAMNLQAATEVAVDPDPSRLDSVLVLAAAVFLAILRGNIR